MDEASESVETTSGFLDAVASKLTAEADIDGPLSAIIRTHILVAAPPDNAVNNAKAAIMALAASRAAPKPEEVADDK